MKIIKSIEQRFYSAAMCRRELEEDGEMTEEDVARETSNIR